ncbi:MAG: hypothetical protein KDD48_01660, partial [Bdellovibrionales bacterium]|nr:hypothetical protein [Bdellovibrionales bacterium]
AEAALLQSKVLEKSENCVRAYAFIHDYATDYAFLKAQTSLVKAHTEYGICTLNSRGYFDRDEIEKDIREWDSSDETVYDLALKARRDDGFFDHIVKNKAKYKNDKKVHAYLFQRAIDDYDLTKPEGKNLDILIAEYDVLSNLEFKKKIKEELTKEFDRAIGYNDTLKLSRDDKNYFYLAKKYKLLPANQLDQLNIYQTDGFIALAKKHTNTLQTNTDVLKHLVNIWEQKEVDSKEWREVQSLLSTYNVCSDSKQLNELAHADSYERYLKDAISRKTGPSLYGSNYEKKTLEELRWVEKCKKLTSDELDKFYFLYFLFESPKGGSNNDKANVVFDEAIRRLKKMSPGQRGKLADWVLKQKMNNLFHLFDRQLDKKTAKEYIELLPKLWSLVETDCQAAEKERSSYHKGVVIRGDSLCKHLGLTKS